VIRTCRAMGIESVAIFSKADSFAPHVLEADRAFCVGEAEPAKSYLDINSILHVAAQSKVDAIHPGYGFLSESALFADACRKAGFLFIGPSSAAIEAMASKTRAKEIAEKAAVPILPGFKVDANKSSELIENARKVGYPLLIKASAGGGGRGMRIVREEKELDQAILSAEREAALSFGDGSLLIEKYISPARHIEVQVLGDQHGNLVHFFDRECSLQRRHQKVIEEAPSPNLSDSIRTHLYEASLRCAAQVEYSSLGTFEYVLDREDNFYFLEMNTRLQVEHGVTEMICDVDLVKEQIRVAEGHLLPFKQDDIVRRGYAIETRLCAEDARNAFQPQQGKITHWGTSKVKGLRVDSGVEENIEVTPYYDSMIAKFLAFSETRLETLRKLRYALEKLEVCGVTTNRDFLVYLLSNDRVIKGDLDTDLLNQKAADFCQKSQDSKPLRVMVAGCLASLKLRSQNHPSIARGFRNNLSDQASIVFHLGEKPFRAFYRNTSAKEWKFEIEDQRISVQLLSEKIINQRYEIVALFGNKVQRFHCILGEKSIDIFSEGQHFHFQPQEKLRTHKKEEPKQGEISHSSGKVVAIHVKQGDMIQQGDMIAIVESMKLEQSLKASKSGRVLKVLVKEGDFLETKQPIIEIQKEIQKENSGKS
jgi:geranyl-CoA carboxylase alpha subunit